MTNRPDNISPENLAVWTAKFDDDSGSGELAMLLKVMPTQRDFFRELYIAGQWLQNEVVTLGATEDESEAVCFANGQRLTAAAGSLPLLWQITKESLEKYREGRPDKPGGALALEVMTEQGLIRE